MKETVAGQGLEGKGAETGSRVTEIGVAEDGEKLAKDRWERRHQTTV